MRQQAATEANPKSPQTTRPPGHFIGARVALRVGPGFS
jgi:hypothetical protein